MANGDRIIIGIQPGRFILQEDPVFAENQWGFDDGRRVFLTHPNTQKSAWPQRNQADSEYSRMFVTDVVPRNDASGLVELTVLYRGIMRFTSGAGVMKERLLPEATVAMFTLPALSSGQPVRVVAPIPKPATTREYVTLTRPTLNGVSQTIAATWLPSPLPSFSISYIPDPDQPPTLNYGSGWKLDDRSWQDIADSIWLVREYASFYYPLAV